VDDDELQGVAEYRLYVETPTLYVEPTAFYVEECTFYVEPATYSSTLSTSYVEDNPLHVE
jgi:hypothetical protein